MIKIDMSKLTSEEIKILAQAARNKNRIKVNRVPHPDDNKTWAELFDLTPPIKETV